uniref:homeobox-leucine zipper protein ROC8-like n=1 Tax=Pistacia vera TaxID=55513 RepID=UPI001262D062|nr:homeobox-leucine zipper protein ROC8-like [Pistacia vera]
MDFVMGSGGNSGDEQEVFQGCPHPDDNQRRQLGRELGLDPKQIKFWFQNKRTQTKVAQNEKADNSVLRAENERIQAENSAIRDALKNVICPSCGGPPCGEEERQLCLQNLHLDNARLKEEHEKLSNLLAKFIGKPIPHIDALMPIPGSTFGASLQPNFQNQAMGRANLDPDLGSGPLDNISLPFQFKGITDVEKTIMVETATNGMDELIRLLRIDEPLWNKCLTDGTYVINRDSYEKICIRASHFNSSSARFESSKDSRIVNMNAMQLIDNFLDSDKWVDIFPTIVTEARTIQVLEEGIPGNRSGCLQLMYEQMHILSPLVAPREYYFLRHCQQIEQGLWVMVDVSCDWPPQENISPSRCWRLPSGCMIQEMPNGCSNVTWVEHVEVDDKSQTHRLYRDLMCSSSAYGAERWVVTLQRICERLSFSMDETLPTHELGGVINSPEGRKSIMKLGHRMVKNFCGILNMSSKLDFPQLSEVNNSGVRVAVRQNIQEGQPSGTVVSAATSLWLPLPTQNIFNFFKDPKMRVHWDTLSNGNPANEIAHISNGAHPGNYTSIIRPFVPTENNMLMLQESYIDVLGSMIVYAPIDIPSVNLAISGKDSSDIAILPSGFIISGDGRPDNNNGASTSSNSGSPAGSSAGGSLLTVALQILVSSSKEVNVESVATVNTLISSTVQRIKATLNCCNLD